MVYRMRPLVAALTMIFSGAVFAEATRQPQTLDDVLVRGHKETPLPAAQALEAKHLQAVRSTTDDTASLLRDVPGVALQAAGGASGLPVIHGLADDRLRITVDGMDFIASCPNHMNPPLSYLAPSQISTLKVYAGIAPVSVGGDSIGGSVVAETAAPVFAEAGQSLLSQGELGAIYRSNGNARSLNAAATLASEQISLSYRGAWNQSDNYEAGGDFRNGVPTGRSGHLLGSKEVGSTAYETRTHTLGLAVRGGAHLIDLRLGFQEVPQQLYPNQRMDMLDNQQKRANLRYLGQFDWGQLEARAYHEQVDHMMDFGADKRYWYGTASGGSTAANGVPCSPISATCAAGMPMYTRSETTGFNLKADIALGQSDLLRLGGLYQHYRLNDWWPPSGSGMWPATFDNIKDGTRERAGLFGEWEAHLSAQWQSLLGLRYERVSSDAGNVQGYSTASGAMGNQVVDANAFNARAHHRSDNNWDMTALARYAASSALDLEFGVARKVRSPNLYERYTWSTWTMAAVMNNFVGDGNGYIGNPDLKPEKAHTVSLTADWHSADQRSALRITPYYTLVDDYIDAVRCSNAGMAGCPGVNTANNQFLRLQYANQDARLYGLDLSWRLPLASTGLGSFGLKGVLNYTKGKNRDTGDGLYNIMPLNARFILTQQTGGWDNALELVAVKGKDDVSSVRNEIQTAGYTLTNLRASYTWQKNYRIDFGIENLFDRYYVQPLGGAYSGQGTTMSINGIPWGIGVPGMGRNLYAGLNVKF